MLFLNRFLLCVISLQLALCPLAATENQVTEASPSESSEAPAPSPKPKQKKRNWKRIALAIGIPVLSALALTAGLYGGHRWHKNKTVQHREDSDAQHPDAHLQQLQSAEASSLPANTGFSQARYRRQPLNLSEEELCTGSMNMSSETIDEVKAKLAEIRRNLCRIENRTLKQMLTAEQKLLQTRYDAFIKQANKERSDFSNFYLNLDRARKQNFSAQNN